MARKRTVQVSYYNYDIPGAEEINPARVKPTGNAEPTSRLLDGSSDHGYAEEWQEPAILPDGRKCYRMYLFDAGECDREEAEDYPWDDEHVRRIKLVDEGIVAAARTLGRRGGLSRTEAKAAASRANGRKGGWPRKSELGEVMPPEEP